MNKPKQKLEVLAEKTLNFLRWVNITYGNLTHFDLMYINMAEKTKKKHTVSIYTYEETIKKIVNHAEKLLKIIIGTEDHKVHFLHNLYPTLFCSQFFHENRVT